MPWTTAGKNLMLDALTTLYAAAFDGDPRTTGTETSVARVPVSYGPAANGLRELTSQPVVTVAGGKHASWGALFTAATGGIMPAVDDLGESVTSINDFNVTLEAFPLDLTNDPA